MGSSSTTKAESAPPEWATPLYEQSASEASRLYNSGVGGNTYLGSTVAPLSGTTMQGVNDLATAGANWDTAGTRPLFGAIGAGLAPTASGDMLTANPYLDQVIGSAGDDIRNQVAQMASGAGRYGSGAHQDLLSDSIADMAGAMRFGNYNAERDRQMRGLGMAHQVAGSIAGLDQQNFNNSLTGAGATLQAGGIMDDQAQQLLSEEERKFYQLDNQDFARLGMLQQAAAGAAGPYGQQLQQTQTSNPGAVLGGIASGIGGLK